MRPPVLVPRPAMASRGGGGGGEGGVHIRARSARHRHGIVIFVSADDVVVWRSSGSMPTPGVAMAMTKAMGSLWISLPGDSSLL